MHKISRGDKQSFELLFKKFYTSLCAFAYNYISSEECVVDIVQDVFMKIWERKKEFNNVSDIKSYLYIAVRNSCLNEINKTKNLNSNLDIELLKTDVIYKEGYIQEETYRMLRKVINDLPEQTRKIVYMTYEGVKNPEIAEELGISKHTVHTLKKRAYKKLRERLKEHRHLAILFFL